MPENPMKYTSVIVLTEDQKHMCYAMAADGKTFPMMAKALGIGPVQFFDYRNENPGFSNRLNSLRADHTHSVVDGIVKRMEDHPDPKTARNVLQATQWQAAMKNRTDYGTKVDINVHKTIDITAVLDTAERRIQPILDVTPTKQLTQVTETAVQSQLIETGLEPGHALSKLKPKSEFDELL